MKRRSQKKNKPESQVNEALDLDATDSDLDGAECAPGDQVVVSHGADLTSIDENHPLSAPINDLARAFAMQAEMLKVLHENQTEIMRTMKNDGRSEMMLNSTKALNDTFRGVKEVQEGLIKRLGSTEGGGGSSSWLMAGLVIVFLLLGGGSFYWAISSGLLVVSDSKVTTEKLARMEEAEEQRSAEQIDELSQATAEQSRLAADRKERIGELENDLRALDIQRAALADEGVNRAEVSAELEKLKKEAAASEARYDAIRAENQRLSEASMARLRESLIRPAKGVAPPTVQPIPTPTTSVPKVQPASVAKTEVPTTESGALAKHAMTTLNRLLLKHRSDHLFRIESIGSVAGDHLLDVVLVESSGGGDVIKRVEASKLIMHLSDVGGILELQFSSGSVRHGKRGGGLAQPSRFYKGRYRMMIYTLNSADWKRSKLSFVN